MKHRFLIVIETPMGIVPAAKMVARDIGSWMGSLSVEEQVDVDVLEVRYIGSVNHAEHKCGHCHENHSPESPCP